jgi:hypothetical protein
MTFDEISFLPQFNGQARQLENIASHQREIVRANTPHTSFLDGIAGPGVTT